MNIPIWKAEKLLHIFSILLDKWQKQCIDYLIVSDNFLVYPIKSKLH